MNEQSATVRVTNMIAHFCSNIGPRPAGGPAIAAARAYVAEELRSIGATSLSEEPVRVPYWDGGRATLVVGDERIECYACFGAGSGRGEGRLRTVNRALLPADIGPADRGLRGAVAVVHGHETAGGAFVPLGEQLAALPPRGVECVVLVSETETDRPAVENVQGEGTLAVPCVAVSKSDGVALLKLVKRGAHAAFAVENPVEPAVCANLVADFEPRNLTPDGCIVLGAHLDSYWNSPGAFDNLTGVLTVLETARRLVELRSEFARTLRIVLYTAEELSMIGSKTYVETHRNELDEYRFIYNMDSIFPQTSRGLAVMMSEFAGDMLRTISEKLRPPIEVRDMFCMSSDYLPFIIEGIPAARPADFEDAFPDWSHTDLDVADRIASEWVTENARVHAHMIQPLLTFADRLPFARREPHQVAEILDAENVRSGLAAMGFV